MATLIDVTHPSTSQFVKRDLKTCYKCGEEKTIDLFTKDYNKNRPSYGKPTTLCKKCKSRKDHVLRKKNGRGAKERNRLKLRNLEVVWNALVGKQCMDCGENNILVLEFDHILGEKKMAVITMAANRLGNKEAIKAEIEKCEIVCSNCHTIRTMRRGNHWRYQMAIERGIIKP